MLASGLLLLLSLAGVAILVARLASAPEPTTSRLQETASTIFVEDRPDSTQKQPSPIRIVTFHAETEMPAKAPDNQRAETRDVPAPPHADVVSVKYVEESGIKLPNANDSIREILKQGDSQANKPLCTTEACKGGTNYCGTAVAFLPSPKIAAEEAAKQHKLLFVLHVSGNFEDAGFT
jgi:hypothetical protein